MKHCIIAVLCLFSLVSAASGNDSVSSLRCKDGVVSVGSNQAEVLSCCGEPLTRNRVKHFSSGPDQYYSGTRVRDGRQYTSVTDEWTYNLGRGDFLYIFEFEGSTVRKIVRGSRGF